jgi:hypothetical protein
MTPMASHFRSATHSRPPSRARLDAARPTGMREN